MKYVLTLDFETRDPSISRGTGAGWPFKDFDVLGAAYQIDDNQPQFTSDMEKLREVVKSARTLIAHNAQYDIGILHRLKIPYEDKTIIDTMILATLYDNSMEDYSLDVLSSWLLGEGKDYKALEEAAEACGVKKYMSHMDILFEKYPELVARYAKQDVSITYRLSQWFKTELYSEALELVPLYSDLIKALVLWRSRGIKINLDQLAISNKRFGELYEEHISKFYSYLEAPININSSDQVADAMIKLGLAPGVTEKGKYSVDKKWRELQSHPAVIELSKAKEYLKLNRDFVLGIETRLEGGFLYPEMVILGAKETGRFSSKNPNIQNIPKRGELSSELVRSLVIPDEGKTLAALDFSSQEPRIQVHYAFLADCPGAEVLRKAYLDNPNHDLHTQVAELASIERKQAKTINLGISYGMGRAKLAASLKISEEEAKELIGRYNKLVPYLKTLNRKVQESGIKKGYITTLLGRRLKMDPDAPYKALNKLIQGSAADQTTMALVQAYRAGLEVMFAVHDEIVMQFKDPADADKMKLIMEKGTKLTVPSVTEIMEGSSWGTLRSRSS